MYFEPLMHSLPSCINFVDAFYNFIQCPLSIFESALLEDPLVYNFFYNLPHTTKNGNVYKQIVPQVHDFQMTTITTFIDLFPEKHYCPTIDFPAFFGIAPNPFLGSCIQFWMNNALARYLFSSALNAYCAVSIIDYGLRPIMNTNENLFNQ